MCALHHSSNIQRTFKTLLQGQPGQHLFQDRSKITIRNCPHFYPSSVSGHGCRYLSSGEVFTALKPFFFAVHPDLFGQHPRERAVNENSLKQLNEYIESASQNQSVRPTTTRLTFYLRNGNGNASSSSPKITRPPHPNIGNFQSIRIDLGQKDVRQTVYSILEKCNLPTAYVDSIPKTPLARPNPNPFTSATGSDPFADYWRPPRSAKATEAEVRKKKALQDNLESWLEKNVEPAKKKLHECWPIREEIKKLRESICSNMGVADIVWDCGWGMRHFRGCLQSFQAMVSHHPECIEVLKDRTVVFGKGDSGLSLDGHVILNSGEVRANWLDLIKRVPTYDALILTIPSVESALSTALKDIRVVHRKFQPTRLAENYSFHLKKLITSIGDFRGRNKFPKEWPQSLSHLELVVETEAGPLMISPTGQIIVPSSYPPSLLVNFITTRMHEATEKLEKYKEEKYTERDLHAKCVKEFELVALQKDDNVNPTLMIDCCSRLLAHREQFQGLLKGTHLWIATYYSVLSDGEICIPWNWKQ